MKSFEFKYPNLYNILNKYLNYEMTIKTFTQIILSLDKLFSEYKAQNWITNFSYDYNEKFSALYTVNFNSDLRIFQINWNEFENSLNFNRVK